MVVNFVYLFDLYSFIEQAKFRFSLGWRFG